MYVKSPMTDVRVQRIEKSFQVRMNKRDLNRDVRPHEKGRFGLIGWGMLG